MHKHHLVAALVSLGLLSTSGCIVNSKPKTSSQSQATEHKNHGQQRREEVHQRNEERKEAHDAEKANKKK